MNSLLAIDVSSREFEITFANSSALTTKTFFNEPGGIKELVRLAKAKQMWIVLEATGSYHMPLVLAAQEAGVPVSVLNPAQVRQFRRSQGYRSKTDRIDARAILRYAQGLDQDGRLKPLPPVDYDLLHLRKLLSLRELLVGQRAAMSQAGISRSLIAHHDAQIKDFEKQIQTLCREQGTLYDRLRDIPFVGPICAAYLVALLWRPEMFTHFKALTAYCGLDVVLCESGRFKGQRPDLQAWLEFLPRRALGGTEGGSLRTLQAQSDHQQDGGTLHPFHESAALARRGDGHLAKDPSHRLVAGPHRRELRRCPSQYPPQTTMNT